MHEELLNKFLSVIIEDLLEQSDALLSEKFIDQALLESTTFSGTLEGHQAGPETVVEQETSGR